MIVSYLPFVYHSPRSLILKITALEAVEDGEICTATPADGRRESSASYSAEFVDGYCEIRVPLGGWLLTCGNMSNSVYSMVPCEKEIQIATQRMTSPTGLTGYDGDPRWTVLYNPDKETSGYNFWHAFDDRHNEFYWNYGGGIEQGVIAPVPFPMSYIYLWCSRGNSSDNSFPTSAGIMTTEDGETWASQGSFSLSYSAYSYDGKYYRFARIALNNSPLMVRGIKIGNMSGYKSGCHIYQIEWYNFQWNASKKPGVDYVVG